jgi:hypothetical protein
VVDVKATAIQKLIYLQMVGYDMQWASFHVIEVMSQPWYVCMTPTRDGVDLILCHLMDEGVYV